MHDIKKCCLNESTCKSSPKVYLFSVMLVLLGLQMIKDKSVKNCLSVCKELTYSYTLKGSRKQNQDDTSLNYLGSSQGKLQHVLSQITGKNKCASIFG